MHIYCLINLKAVSLMLKVVTHLKMYLLMLDPGDLTHQWLLQSGCSHLLGRQKLKCFGISAKSEECVHAFLTCADKTVPITQRVGFQMLLSIFMTVLFMNDK
ncbi:hypothetical protein ILYODFUR_019443 [Ilyodon furcidens]|uniref:Uncharacterized protein n=1 Tax=Ilyodon furcidens TaxID=33524 RepID=A0ABV0TL02_9TELE